MQEEIRFIQESTLLFRKRRVKIPNTDRWKYAFQVIRVQMAVSVEDLIRRLNIYGRRVVFLGDGVPVYRKMLEKGLKVPYFFAPSYLNRQRAAVVGALGIRYFKMGRYETAAEHKPDYLRVSQAERERAAKEKNAAPEIRRMVMEDGAAIAELEYSLFRDAWSEKSILETLKQPNAICLIAEKADRTAGYLLAYTAAGRNGNCAYRRCERDAEARGCPGTFRRA